MILRSAKLSEQLKRDGQHETPRDTVTMALTTNPVTTSAPGLSSRRRSCRLMELKVSSEKSSNSFNFKKAAISTPSKNISRSHVHSEHQTTEFFDQPVPDPTVDKTPESIHQVQPYSVPYYSSFCSLF